MTFKCESNPFVYVEGLQFIDGLYSTDKEAETAILKRYKDSISVIEDEVEEVKEPEKLVENIEGTNGAENVDSTGKTTKTKTK